MISTKDKIKLIRLGVEERRLYGCTNLLGDHGRALLAQVYADVIRRHPTILGSRRHFPKVVRAVHNMISA